MSSIAEVQKITGIQDLSTLSDKDFQRILKLIDSKNLNTKHVKILYQTNPKFMLLLNQLSQELLVDINQLKIDNNNSKKVDYLKHLALRMKEFTEYLFQIEKNLVTSEEKSKMADRIMELAKMEIDINKLLLEQEGKNDVAKWSALASVFVIVQTVAVEVVKHFIDTHDKG